MHALRAYVFFLFFYVTPFSINHDIKLASLPPLMFIAVSAISVQVFRYIEKENVLFGLTGARFMKPSVETFVESYESTLSSPVSSYVL